MSQKSRKVSSFRAKLFPSLILLSLIKDLLLHFSYFLYLFSPFLLHPIQSQNTVLMNFFLYFATAIEALIKKIGKGSRSSSAQWIRHGKSSFDAFIDNGRIEFFFFERDFYNIKCNSRLIPLSFSHWIIKNRTMTIKTTWHMMICRLT